MVRGGGKRREGREGLRQDWNRNGYEIKYKIQMKGGGVYPIRTRITPVRRFQDNPHGVHGLAPQSVPNARRTRTTPTVDLHRRVLRRRPRRTRSLHGGTHALAAYYRHPSRALRYAHWRRVCKAGQAHTSFRALQYAHWRRVCIGRGGRGRIPDIRHYFSRIIGQG